MESDGYGGIFAGAANSCSVPFLDIPPSSHCSDSQIIDYSEIFGGSNGDGDFALIDYEELIKASKKKTEGSSDSSNARISTEANLSQQFVEASLFPEENLGDCSMKNSSSSSSDYNNDTLKQFSMSYHGLSHDSREDFVSGKRCITQLRAIPGYSIVIDSCSSLANVQHDSSVQIQTNDLLHSVSSDGRLNDAELGKEESHTSSTDNTKSYKDDMNTNQKDFTTKLKHYSQSSSSYLTSCVDLSYPSVTYVSAYDINLRTKPSNVPPPSRAPPKLFSKQVSSKMKTCRSSKGDQEEGNILKPVPNHQIHYRVGVSKSGRFDGEAKDTTSRFFEADEDASSAAAAMKEAMEQAQAKLRSAKELMERQQDNLPSRKKQGHKETKKYNETEIQTSEKGKIFHDGITKKSLLKDMNKVKKYAVDDITNVGTTEKKEVYVVKAEESQPPRQGNGYKSSQRPYKSEELSGDQKTEKQFYELANNEKFRVLKEAFKHEGVERKPKTATDFCEDRHEGNANVEMGDDNSIAGNITLKEDIGEKPNSFLETCFLKEIVSKLEEEDHSFNPQYKNEKIKADQESLIRERKLMAQYSSENMSLRGMSQKNDGFSSDALKLEEIYQDNEENGNSQVAEEACLHAVSVKKLSGTNLTSLSESEEKSNVNMLDSHLSSYGENKCKLEGTISASEQKESRKLDGEFMQVENDLESMLPQDENEMIENSEITKEMKSTEVIWPDFAETIEATWERLQNKKKADASKVLSVKKNTVKPRDSADRESKEGHEAARTSQNFVPGVHKTEKAEKEGKIGVERELEKVTARKTEEEKERQMEREKDRGTVEKAADEAHERALSEARERFGRIAVERGTAEVQQKALAFKLKEAKLRAGRAAVERALAEARELAVKKALDEIAAADARKRAEKLSATSREKGRKENESGDIFGDCDGEIAETRLKAGPSNVLHDARFLYTGSSSSSQRHADSYPHGEVESPLRFKARLERHQRTSDRAAKALAEKNMRDVLVQREQAERNRFAESLDGEIRRWATGKEGNLRALLSTLQYILGPESGWQPIPLTDVITAAAVKKAYRKATLCVHPDKLQQRGANVQQKYICEKVFDLLKDAWSQFNSEER